jgi:hypothetical protein
MPAPTLHGIATITGMNGATATFTGVTATITPLSADMTSQFDEDELKDGNGNVVATGATNPNEDVQIELFITGADVATCRTMAKPTPNAILTLASMPVTADNGTFNIKTFARKFSETFAKITMRAKRYGAVGSAAALTTPS